MWFSLLTLLLLSISVSGWDQIQVKTFATIFPYAKQADVWKLTFDVNHQESPEASRKVLNDWINTKWVQIMKANTGTGKNEVDLSDKEFARKQAISFIQHRWSIKQFIRHLFRRTQYETVFNEAEAEKMREIFWQSDTDCLNYFRCTGPMFVNKTSEQLATKKRPATTISSDLYLYAIEYTSVSSIEEKLNWKLAGGRSREPDFDFGYLTW